MAESRDDSMTLSPAAAAAAQEPLAGDTRQILSNAMRLKSALTNIIEPDFGLLDELLSREVLTRSELADVRSERTVYRRNNTMLDLLVSEDQCDKFLTSLVQTSQQHVVNFVTHNGDIGAEFGDIRPLDAARMRLMAVNGVKLLDLIDSNDAFVSELASPAVGVITWSQRQHLMEIVHSRDRNDKLLEFLTRRSVADFKKFTTVLSKYQSHLVPLLVTDAVVVGVDAVLEEWSVDDVVQCEDRIVSQSRDLLPAGSKAQIRQGLDDFNEILRPLGLETQLVVLSRANSIALFFLCMTLSAVMSLRDHWRTGRLRNIVQKLFNFLSGSTCDVYVNRLSWPLNDYERCCEFFHSLQGQKAKATGKDAARSLRGNRDYSTNVQVSSQLSDSKSETMKPKRNFLLVGETLAETLFEEHIVDDRREVREARQLAGFHDIDPQRREQIIVTLFSPYRREQGRYILRATKSNPNAALAISVTHNEQIRHYYVYSKHQQDRVLYCIHINEGYRWDSLDSLLEHYHRHPIECCLGADDLLLTEPIL